MDRRSIIKNAGIAGVLAAGAAPAVHAQATLRWRCASSFPKALDTLFGVCDVFAKKVGELSGGKFTITTHAGNYDIAYLRCIPNMSIACPADENECRQLLSSAFEQNHPVAVRYPRGAGVGVAVQPSLEGLPFGKGEIRLHGDSIAILAFGTLLYPAMAVADKLGLTAVNMRWAKPLDTELLLQVARNHAAIVTVEDAAVMGGAGSAVQEALQAAGVVLPVLSLGLPDLFIEHGDPAKLMTMHGLDASGIEAAINARFAGLLAQAAKGKPLPKAA